MDFSRRKHAAIGNVTAGGALAPVLLKVQTTDVVRSA
jgi:hypothetical protein